MIRPAGAGTLAALVSALLAWFWVMVAPSAIADHQVCKTLRNGLTYCQVVHDPPPSHGGDGGAGGGNGRCNNDGVTIPCFVPGDGYWDAARSCYAAPMEPPPPPGDPLWKGHTTGAVYRCTDGQGGGFFWSATPPPGIGPTSIQLAQKALATIKAPPPTTGRYPAGTLQDGRPYTVVGPAFTWYWTDPETFTSLSATAQVGGVWATATVTPSRLTFTPGDGNHSVSCAGPGTAWNASYGVWAASPTGCDYQYPHSSIHEPNREVTATYGINWAVSWVGSGGAEGDLPGFTTTSTSTFAVAEVEAVVSH